jgi:TrmH family RNA methyltransferase
MTPITSANNPRLKELRKLARTRERSRTGLFVAEGEDLVGAAHAAGRAPVWGLRAAGVEVGVPGFEEVAPELLAQVSALGSGTRAIGVYEHRFGEARGPLCVYLHGVRDPGNVGTVLRGALAFGASSVALGPGCADPFSPKAVRASMGAVFSVELARVAGVEELPGQRVALVAGGGESLSVVLEVVLREGASRAREPINTHSLLAGHARARGTPKPDTHHTPPPAVTLLVGAEREGLPKDVVSQCEHVAHISIAADSLNAAMAATVALYETTRASTRLTDRGARPKPGDTSLRLESPIRPAGLRPAAPPSRVPKS